MSAQELSTGVAAGGADGARSHVQFRHERARRIWLSVFSSLLTKPLAFAIPLLTIPLFFRYLGQERYGLYESVTALSAWLGLMNLGLGLGLVNRLTECHVSGDRALARRYVSNVVLATGALAAAGTVLVAVLALAVNWAHLFGVSDARMGREVGWSVLVAGVATVVGLVASVSGAVYVGYQETHRSNLWDGATKVLTLAAMVGAVFTPFGLVGVTAAAVGAPCAVRLVNVLYQFGWERPWLRPTVRDYDRAVLRSLLGEGVCLFVIQSAAVAIFQSDKLVVGIVVSPSAVAPYAVLSRLFLIVWGVFGLVLAPLWPAFGEALRRGDLGWVRRTLRWSVMGGVGAMFACGVVMLVGGDTVIRLWTRGQGLHVSRQLVVAMSLACALWVWMGCQSIVLNAAGVLRPQMLFIGVQAVLNLAAAVAGGKWLGVEGVAWAIVVSGLVSTAWGYPWMVHRYLRGAVRMAGENPAAAVAAEAGVTGTSAAGELAGSGAVP